MQNEKETIFLNNKKIGEIIEKDKSYVSYRNNKHLFRIFDNGFGASVKLIDYLIERKIIWFIINYENNRAYYCEVEDFIIYGEEYNDNGDLQLILPGYRWKEYKKEVS